MLYTVGLKLLLICEIQSGIISGLKIPFRDFTDENEFEALAQQQCLAILAQATDIMDG